MLTILVDNTASSKDVNSLEEAETLMKEEGYNNIKKMMKILKEINRLKTEGENGLIVSPIDIGYFEVNSGAVFIFGDSFKVRFADIKYYDKTYHNVLEKGIFDLRHYLKEFKWIKKGPYKIVDGIDYTKMPSDVAISLIQPNLEWWLDQVKEFDKFQPALDYFVKLCKMIEDLEKTEEEFAIKLTKGEIK